MFFSTVAVALEESLPLRFAAALFMADTPHKLSISDELRERFEEDLIAQIRDAVQGAQERDDFHQECFEIVEGTSPVQTSAPWPDACNLVVQIVRKAKLFIMGAMINAIKRSQKVTAEAQDPEQEASAQAQEAYLANKDAPMKWTSTLAAVADFSTTYMMGVSSTQWVERKRYVRDSIYHDKATGAILTGDSLDPDRPDDDYREQQVRALDYEYKGVETRAVNSRDFYLYPPNAISIDRAIGCGERMLFTENDLYAGIRDYGFTHSQVTALIDFGPCALNREGTGDDTRSEMEDFIGVERAVDPRGQFYECFQWFFKPPHIYSDDGELETPEYLLDDDLMAFVCPAAGIVLRMDFAPETVRPYDSTSMLPRENEFYGVSCPILLYTEYTEMNATVRQYIDALQFTINPAFKVSEKVKALNQSMTMFPGRQFYVTDHSDIMPFEMPSLSHDPMSVKAMIEGDAKDLYAGSNTLGAQTKVKKAAQIQQEQQQISSMVSLYLYYWGKFVEAMAAKIIAVASAHMDEEGEEFADEMDHKTKITPQQLRGHYVYKAAFSDMTADPVTRLQMAQEWKNWAVEYAEVSRGMMAAGDVGTLKRIWHAYRTVYIDSGHHNPEVFIGEEPEAPQQPAQPPNPPPGETNTPPPPQQGATNGHGQNGSALPQLAGSVG